MGPSYPPKFLTEQSVTPIRKARGREHSTACIVALLPLIIREGALNALLVMCEPYAIHELVATAVAFSRPPHAR
jgi:hypothetical protein